MNKTIVGCKEIAKVCINGHEYEFTATMDTGNSGMAPTLGVSDVFFSKEKLRITINGDTYILENKGEITPMVGNVMHRRPIILLDYLEIAGKRIENVYCAITDQRKKTTQMLINKNIMSKMNFLIDPSIENV